MKLYEVADMMTLLLYLSLRLVRNPSWSSERFAASGNDINEDLLMYSLGRS